MTLHAGWIGVGKMGEAMAARLLEADIAVTAWNRTAAKCAPLEALGATVAKTPADAANVDVMFSMVLDDAALGELCERADGPLAGSAKVWVDCSSVSPGASAKAAAAAAAHGIGFVAAPVSGNPGVVRAGNLVFAVSGASADIDIARPYFEAMGRAVHVVGDANQATVVKICTNAMLGVLMETLSEVLVLGESNGVRRTDLLSFMNDSAVGSPFSTYKAAALTALDLTPTFTPPGMKKDLNLALGLWPNAEAPTPVVRAAQEQFVRLAASEEWASADIAAALLQVASDAGLQLTPEA